MFRTLVRGLQRDSNYLGQHLSALLLLALGTGCRRKLATVVPELTESLRPGHPCRQLTAAWLLGDLGAKAAPSLPALFSAMTDEDTLVRETAAVALDHICAALGDREEVLPHLPPTESLIASLPWCLVREGEPRLRGAALRLTRRLGPVAAPLVGAVIDCSDDPDDDVRALVADALGSLESEPEW